MMGMFATGVTVLTTRDAEGRPYGLTANAVTSLSLSPPLLVICIDKKAETHPHFFDSRCFVVNILAEHQEDLSTHFAKSGGDKFGAVPFSTNQDGVPVLEGTLAQVECRIVATHEGGHHHHPHRRGTARRDAGRPAAPVLPGQVSPARRLTRRRTDHGDALRPTLVIVLAVIGSWCSASSWAAAA